MEIQFDYLKKLTFSVKLLRKKYICDVLDQDMIQSTNNKKVVHFVINDMCLTSKNDVDKLIKMLNNVKESFSQ